GLAFLFVPITTVSYAGIASNKSNDASALINLMRNLGGSLGISLGQTSLARRQQFHQSRLVEHLVLTNPTFNQAMQQIQQKLLAGGAWAGQVEQAALAQLNHTLQNQIQMLAYLDVFRLLGWCAVAATPLVLLLKHTKPGQAHGH